MRPRALVVAGIVALVAAAVVVAVAILFDFGGKGPTGPRRGGAAATEADNGGEVSVTLGQPFRIALKGSPDAPWAVPVAQSDSLAPAGSQEELDGSVSVTFVPLETSPGVLVTAERTGAKAEHFEVTVRVVR